MNLATAMEKARSLSRTNITGASDVKMMQRINDALKEFAEFVHGFTRREYITITPSFDVQTNFAINLTITGGTNALAATNIVIAAVDGFDQTGDAVAAALQAAIRAAGPPTLTVSWSASEWRFSIDAVDAESITIAGPVGINYINAVPLLGLVVATTIGTSVTGSIPVRSTVEHPLPPDFLSLMSPPEWDGDALAQGNFADFLSPDSCGTPRRYFIRNKRIMLYPPPSSQKSLRIFYKYLPTPFTVAAGYQECGLSGKAPDSSTGLAHVTAYSFRVAIDGGVLTEYSITTGTVTTFEEILDLMNDQIRGAAFALENGDLRCTSNTLSGASAVALAAGITGNDLFSALTGFIAFEPAVATQAGVDLPVDDEWCEAVVYFAASKIAEENFEKQQADRYMAQFTRIATKFIMHRSNQNMSLFPVSAPTSLPEVTFVGD